MSHRDIECLIKAIAPLEEFVSEIKADGRDRSGNARDAVEISLHNMGMTFPEIEEILEAAIAVIAAAPDISEAGE